MENKRKELMGHDEVQNAFDDETEDEEVKLNCIGGIRGCQDSDFGSDSGEDEQYDREEEQDMEEETPREDGVVEFSCGLLQETNLGSVIVRPKPERLSPHPEEAYADDGSASASSANTSMGGRAAAISSRVIIVNDDNSPSDIGEPSDDERFSSGENCCKEAPNLKEEPPILPQQSILQEKLLVKSKFESIGPQKSFNKVAPKAKRVLSSNTLTALNAEAGRNSDSPKRIRADAESFNCLDLPELSLGLSAVDAIQPLFNRYSICDGAQAISSHDDEELDKALSDELKRPSKSCGENSPVPLLTPPQSPLTLPAGCSGFVEWPSNMVVDSAMMSVAAITRALSAPSLQKLEQDEEARLNEANSHPEPSSLTPLLRSIYVGTA